MSAIPATFSVRRGYEGPQVIIEWGDSPTPGDVLSLRLVRRLYGFPSNENDGEIIYDGVGGARTISDRDVEHARCYYYKIFVTTPSGVVSNAFVQADVIALQTGFFAEKTYELLSEDLKTSDKGLEGEDEIRVALAEGPNPATTSPEVFNLAEDGTVKKGPLRRLFKVLGPALDEAKGLIDALSNQLDVDDACLANLTFLASTLGLTLNRELTPEKMRNELREHVNFLKLKGTIPGLIARLRSVSGLTAQVREQCNNVFFFNDLESLTASFTPAEIDAIGGPDDQLHYVTGYSDTPPFWLWFTVFLDLALGSGASQVLVRKWCIAIDEASPTCHKGFLTVRSLDDETIAVQITDEASDEAEDDLEDTIAVQITDEATDQQVADPSRWLIFTDAAKTFNDATWTAVFAEETLP